MWRTLGVTWEHGQSLDAELATRKSTRSTSNTMPQKSPCNSLLLLCRHPVRTPISVRLLYHSLTSVYQFLHLQHMEINTLRLLWSLMRCGKRFAYYENSVFFKFHCLFLAQSIIIWTVMAAFQLVFLSTGPCLVLFKRHTPHSHRIHLQRHHFHHAILFTRNPQWLLRSLPTTGRIKSKFPYWHWTITTWLRPNIRSFLPLLLK